ncbi:sulfatase-like hydrolase/transferase [Vibrio lentus]|nr:sulfatase-like hydrolase/transferase [Vibrio lentus]
MYISIHGESLGENGVYLHGMPYSLAPKEQTHVPMILWMSDGLRRRKGCLDLLKKGGERKQSFSHDNPFDSSAWPNGRANQRVPSEPRHLRTVSLKPSNADFKGAQHCM